MGKLKPEGEAEPAGDMQPLAAAMKQAWAIWSPRCARPTGWSAARSCWPPMRPVPICRCNACCAGPDGPGLTPPPVLEINPRHPVIRALAAQAERGASIEDATRTLFDLARVQEGDLPSDPAGFAARVSAFMRQGLGEAA